METLLKKEVIKVYERENLTASDIEYIRSLEINFAELVEDTRIFKNLNEYVEYIYYADNDLVPLLRLTQYMIDRKDDSMKLKDVLIQDNAKQLDNGKIFLFMG